MTDTQDLLRLADEVAAAPAEMQAVMLDRAWETLAKHSAEFRDFATAPLSSFGTNAGKFAMAMDAHAYESAAQMLVPDGWGWFVSQPNAKAIASGLLKERTPVHGEVQYGCDHRYAVAAATPALALCAAALKARAHSTKENTHVG